MPDISTNNSTEKQANALADYLPNGVAYRAKKLIGTTLNKLLRGFAGTYLRAQQYVNAIALGYDFTTSTELLTEWESALGIPDLCFPGTGTDAERQRDILVKLGKMNISTAIQYEELADFLGFDVDVETGWANRGDFPVGAAGDIEAKFTIIIIFNGLPSDSVFPVPFPWNFANPAYMVQCIFNFIKPANVAIQYRFT